MKNCEEIPHQHTTNVRARGRSTLLNAEVTLQSDTFISDYLVLLALNFVKTMEWRHVSHKQTRILHAKF